MNESKKIFYGGRKMKKTLALVLALCMIFALAACGSKPAAQAPAAEAKVKIGMVTDVGGVNDKSFNQTSWKACRLWPPRTAALRSSTSNTRPTSTPSSTRATT